MGRGVTVKMKGFDELVALLKKWPKSQGRKALRKAINNGTAELRKAVKAGTPVDQGVLNRAQDSKVSVKGERGYGIVGANVDKLKAASAADPARPTNIDWLVENGHVAPNGTFVPPSGFMRRAAREAMPAAEARAIAVLKTEIDKMRAAS